MGSLDQSQPQHLTREGVSIAQLPMMEDQAPPKTPNHDPADVLPSILSLAALFKTCVEALSLVHAPAKSVPSPKQYETLLTKLGIQQARLLIWGDALGLSSPPAWIADHFVPTHPSPTYPDVTEPMYFPRRSARLDEPEIRKQAEALLRGILDREMNKSREEAMEEFGLRPPKKGLLGNTNESKEAEELIVLDAFRLEAFREKYDLLLDVAEDKGVGGVRRQSSIIATPWVIGDVDRFERFITTIRQTMDELIALTDVRKAVNLALKMDVRALGWHINSQPGSAARARQKLRAIMDACKGQYQYQELYWAAEEAMDNIAEKWRGPQAYVHTIEEALQPNQDNKAPALATTIKATVPTLTKTAVTTATTQVMPDGQDGSRQPALAFNTPSKPLAQSQSHALPRSNAQKEKKRPAFLKVFKPKSWRNSRTSTGSGEDLDPPRAHSEWAPVVPQAGENSDGGTLSRSRSESVPDYQKSQQDNTYTTTMPERNKSISTAVVDELEVQVDDEKTHDEGVDSKLSSPVDWSNGYAGRDDMGMGGIEHTESRTRQMSIAGT